MDDDRDPESFALARARQLVLEFGQHVRHVLGVIMVAHAAPRAHPGKQRLGRRWRRDRIVAFGSIVGLLNFRRGNPK